MEYTIEGSRINELVVNFIDDYLKNVEINYSHPWDHFVDDDGNYVEGENPSVIYYYEGDDENDDDAGLFRLYFKDYWTGTNPTADRRRSESPLLTVFSNGLENALNGMFGKPHVWEEGMKLWFVRRFDIKVKRVR
jgi:hypothetical protein